MITSFNNITGQSAVQDFLVKAVKNNHVGHALHFLGPEGSGNLSLAMAFATYVMCEQRGENDACGACPSCIKMAGIQHPDVHYVFPVVDPSKNISVDRFMADWRACLLENPLLTYSDWMQTIADENKMGIISAKIAAELQQKISIKAFEGGYRIAIIWMPELMNLSAANKLLKTLEEPPKKTLLLLVGNSANQMLPTILSRVQTVRVSKLKREDIEQTLTTRHQVSPDKAASMALLSDGNLNLALKLVREGDDDMAFFELFRDWFRACYQKSDGLKRVELLDRFAALKREGQKAFLIYSLQMVRQVSLAATGTNELMLVDKEAQKLAADLSNVLGYDQQFKIMKAINSAAYHIERNASAKILFMDLSVKIKNLFHY